MSPLVHVGKIVIGQLLDRLVRDHLVLLFACLDRLWVAVLLPILVEPRLFLLLSLLFLGVTLLFFGLGRRYRVLSLLIQL